MNISIMGESLSKLVNYCDPSVVSGNVRSFVGGKRKRDEDESADDMNTLEKILHTPKRKKLNSTTRYIYQALFKDGRSSDIVVLALGKQWKLHKIYLGQSPYFASMFSGAWREATEDLVHIGIVDPKINIEALEIVFGSLYLDEVVLEPKNIVAVLATATLFQLEGLIEKCSDVMVETVNSETAVQYYEAGCEYGVKSIQDSAFRWLIVNLLSCLQEYPVQIMRISVDLMTKLVTSPDLFVMQTEFALYLLLRYWMYLQVNKEWEINGFSDMQEIQEFFESREGSDPFLLTSEGRKFQEAFHGLRLQHLINHSTDMEIIGKDRIIPDSWFTSPLLTQWSSLLRLDTGADKGPKTVSSEEFLAECFRCGRIVVNDSDHIWRWTGFNYGLDLVWSCDSKSLRVKRMHKLEPEMLLSLHAKRNIILRVTVASLNEQQQIKHTQTTGLKHLSLLKNQEVVLMSFDKELTYPFHLSVNVLTRTPFNGSNTTEGDGPGNENGR